MTRDFSKFLPSIAGGDARPPQGPLQTLGWQPWFARQVSVEEFAATPPVRVVEVHRSGLRVSGDGIETSLPPRADATVGDWLLLDRDQPPASRLLERKSLIKRRAPGHDHSVQLIAANIDTTFIVTSCNQDFNVARLERYVAMVLDAGITPVILLTKSDLAETGADYADEARRISDLVDVVLLDARGDEPRDKLAQWCRPGRTVAFLGSSGVGKSTLTNALTGTQAIATQAIREDDAKGRHTTTRRQLHVVAGGCVVLDTPGMRELQLADAAAGIGDVFADIQDLAARCKFRDCRHVTEPGCAVRQAVEAGTVDAPRLERWRKLMAEHDHDAASLLERKSKDKSLGKLIRQVKKARKTKG